MNSRIDYFNYELLDAKLVGSILKVATKQVHEKYAKLDGFPVPIFLPSGESGKSRKRWRKSDVIDWIERINDT